MRSRFNGKWRQSTGGANCDRSDIAIELILAALRTQMRKSLERLKRLAILL